MGIDLLQMIYIFDFPLGSLHSLQTVDDKSVVESYRGAGKETNLLRE